MMWSIRERQPEEPYYLGRWCASAVLGYEAAEQLVADGHEVGAVNAPVALRCGPICEIGCPGDPKVIGCGLSNPTQSFTTSLPPVGARTSKEVGSFTR